LVFYAALVGWSRVAAGMHFPADVVAGWMLGASSVAIAGLLRSALMSRQGALVKGLSG
ncbi:phosphatase PAP2 family protein, partial [Escherichia coli]|jgi:signal peptidase II|nr:phosphatase PAP2 family protein [Escherichia coli]